ncbi:MAG TPA: bacillithiol system redox-active protein YtxJ [Salinimicrobium sp.]|nr:bacillithiol system redox-active protein YtxJ [Salinimicrobium sp.]
MGIFDKVFKSQDEISKEEIFEVPWHQINEISDLEKIEKESEKHPVVIFKHSTRCGISRMVLKQFESDYKDHHKDDLKLYFLDLLNHRDISNEIAKKFDVVHESPQLIILKNGKVVHHASHHSIDVSKVTEY